MLKTRSYSIGVLIIILSLLFSPLALAMQSDAPPAPADPGTPTQATFKGRCELAGEENTIYENFPECASSPNECFSNDKGFYPLNCFFLIEPIGGKIAYDLYKRVKVENPTGSSGESEGGESGGGDKHDPCASLNVYEGVVDPDEIKELQKADEAACAQQKVSEAEFDEMMKEGEDDPDADPPPPPPGSEGEGGEGPDGLDKGKVTFQYQPWYGEPLIAGLEEGPYQALLAYEPGKDYQGSLGLLYSYVGVGYNYISGFILGVVILIVISAAIRMIASAGNSEQFEKGKTEITKALIGMVIWFLASVILYTINPTFFRF